MPSAKNISAPKPAAVLSGRFWDKFERHGKLILGGLCFFSVTYLFWGEPFLFSAWRATQAVGEFKIKSEMERRDKWGKIHDSENESLIFVGDKVNADFSEPGVFKNTEGQQQTVPYPFRVQRSSEGEILFSPLVRRQQAVTWANRRPQKIVPTWDELMATWTILKKEWAEFVKAHPVRKGASLSKGKGAGKGKGPGVGAGKAKGVKRP